MKELSHDDIVKIAKSFDKYGALNTHKYTYKTKRGQTISLRLLFSHKDKRTLQLLHRILGVGKLAGPYTNKSGGKYWRIGINQKPDIITILNYIEPFISEKRQLYIKKSLTQTENWIGMQYHKEIICKYCSKKFKEKKGRKYCSTKCSQLDRTIERTIILCAYCSKPVSRLASDIKYRKETLQLKNTFCSTLCSAFYYRGPKKEGI